MPDSKQNRGIRLLHFIFTLAVLVFTGANVCNSRIFPYFNRMQSHSTSAAILFSASLV